MSISTTTCGEDATAQVLLTRGCVGSATFKVRMATTACVFFEVYFSEACVKQPDGDVTNLLSKLLYGDVDVSGERQQREVCLLAVECFQTPFSLSETPSVTVASPRARHKRQSAS